MHASKNNVKYKPIKYIKFDVERYWFKFVDKHLIYLLKLLKIMLNIFNEYIRKGLLVDLN